MNKYYIPFNLPNVYQFSALEINKRRNVEKIMAEWCEERIGVSGYPNWQLGNSVIANDNEFNILYQGMYIFNDEDKVAFKITFGL